MTDTYDIVVNSNRTKIECEFEQIHYQITVNEVKNGYVFVNKTSALFNEDVKIDAKPDTGFLYNKGNVTVTDSSGNNIELSNNTFKMPASDVVINAEFSSVPTYLINVKEVTGGTITANGSKFKEGEIVEVTYKADKGYKDVPDSLKVEYVENGVTVVKPIENDAFIMPNKSVEISCEFEKVVYTIKDISKGSYPYDLKSKSAKIGDKIMLTTTYPSGIDAKIMINGLEYTANTPLTEALFGNSEGNVLNVEIVEVDNREIGGVYDLKKYNSGKYKVTWEIHKILSSNAFDMGNKKIAQYCHFDVEFLMIDNKPTVTFFIKEDVMDWLNIDDVAATKGTSFTDANDALRVPYTSDVTMAQINDNILKIEGYVPKAPFEKFRHVTFEIKMNITSAELIAK